jgi:GPH family glycoside/pentoside/hexuronide:cation symporter
MLAGAQYIATWVLHSQGAVTLLFLALVGPALIATPAWTTLSRRTGKEKSFVYASLLFIVAAASIVLLIWMPGAWIYAPVALVGVAYAGMQTLPMAMLPDVVSNDERQHGTGRAGTFSGVWTAGETIGLAFGPVFLTVILAISGYASRVAGDTSVMQTDAAITGIVLSFSAVPAILMALSLVPLGRYRLRRADIETAP